MKLTLTSDTGEVLQEWEANNANWPFFNAVKDFATGIAREAMKIEISHNFSKWEGAAVKIKDRPRLLLPIE